MWEWLEYNEKKLLEIMCSFLIEFKKMTSERFVMKHFLRGSEWRKWDLHVHIPGTKCSDGYEKKDGRIDWVRFCEILHDSDVHGIGITDYFSLDGYFTFIENYYTFYPDCQKVFFPNLELRLTDSVNKGDENVNIHVIFNPELQKKEASKFLTLLTTQIPKTSGAYKSCAELTNEYSYVSVTRHDLANALEKTFGKDNKWKQSAMIVVAANNDGIRVDGSSKRKMYISDEIDKFSDAFFGNKSNSCYFLRTDRYENPEIKSIPKPIFAGCDAHSYTELQDWLGKEFDGKNAKFVTWIKADLTFEGLIQTLIEPEERVRIQSMLPDQKEAYRVISRITFENKDIFPDEVVFNPGLNAIIGSRSSGKSALLAYIAHAIDPEYTIRQQVLASGQKDTDVGPGASLTWNNVDDIKYHVEWVNSAATKGQIIYIPQNSLYRLSERPDDITSKIKPVVFRTSQTIEVMYKKALENVETLNKEIKDYTVDWFSIDSEIVDVAQRIQRIGDIDAITKCRDDLKDEIQARRKATVLTEEDIQQYQEIEIMIRNNDANIKRIESEKVLLLPYLNDDNGKLSVIADLIKISISVEPSSSKLPSGLRDAIDKIIVAAHDDLQGNISSTLFDYLEKILTEYDETKLLNQKINDDNKALIEKNHANEELSLLLNALKSQQDALEQIDVLQGSIKAYQLEKDALLLKIERSIAERDELLSELTKKFNDTGISYDKIVFFMELGYDMDVIERISSGFNKNAASHFIKDSCIDYSFAQRNIGLFLDGMATGKQKLNRGFDKVSLAADVLTLTRTDRFVADMEGDRIGGFKCSSMTPGKQALFALTLILAETDDLWPLLIDQPEDDLDSRSVCNVILQDLLKRKRERQIIMVTHDANLAIGADSEEIIVANKNGDDRKNKDGRRFDYLSGSLEYSKPYSVNAEYILDAAGIREHACLILDGGEDAFQKRKEKYHI